MAVEIVERGEVPGQERPPATSTMTGKCDRCRTVVSCKGGDVLVADHQSSVSVFIPCPVCAERGCHIRVQSDPPWVHPRGLPVNRYAMPSFWFPIITALLILASLAIIAAVSSQQSSPTTPSSAR